MRAKSSEAVSMSTESQFNQVSYVDIGPEQAGQRLDNFLIKILKGVPKSRIYRLLRKGEVRVNKGRVKAESRLKEGDIVRLPPIRVAERGEMPAVGRQLKQYLADNILFEDDGLLIINKPSGLAVHGGSGVSLGAIEALRAEHPELRFLELVHRLDRDTSGCLMLAKNVLYYWHCSRICSETILKSVTPPYPKVVGPRARTPLMRHCVKIRCSLVSAWYV